MKFLLPFLFLTSVSAATIQVGPNKPVKDLSKIADGNEYVLDKGEYAVPELVIKKSLTIRSADVKNPAIVSFKTRYVQISAPDGKKMIAIPSVKCFGDCVMKNVNTKGGVDMVIFQAQPGGTLLAQDVEMLDGGAISISSGGKDIKIIRVQSHGKSHAYFIANFTNPLENILVDQTGNKLPILQGGYCTNGKPTCDNTHVFGEAAVRLMQTKHATFKGIVVKNWLYDGKHEWKQSFQMRTNDLVEVFNSKIDSLDCGDMTWKNPPDPLKKIVFKDSELGAIHLTPGVKQIVYQNTKVAGVLKNETKNYDFKCSKSGCVIVKK